MDVVLEADSNFLSIHRGQLSQRREELLKKNFRVSWTTAQGHNVGIQASSRARFWEVLQTLKRS